MNGRRKMYRRALAETTSPVARKFLRRMRRRPWTHPIEYHRTQFRLRRFRREHPEAAA